MRFLLFLSILILSKSLVADQITKNAENNNFFSRAVVQAPVMIGGEFGYSLSDKWQFSFGAGFVPEIFYNVIAEVSAQYGGNSAYKNVINAAFQNNYLVQAKGRYVISDLSKGGWSVNFSGTSLISSGSAGIDEVLAAANGRDYTNLKNLLIAIGRSPNVDIDSNLILADINFTYSWTKWGPFAVDAILGISKVISADVKLKSGLSNFESTQAGNSLMRQSENDIESIILDYGLTPTIGVQFTYAF